MKYSEKQINFIDVDIPGSLGSLLRDVDKNISIIDLGCGDGKFLYALKNKNLLNNTEKIVGIDLSKERIKIMKMLCSFADGLTANASNMGQIKDNSLDLAISSQVIEYILEDRKMFTMLDPAKYIMEHIHYKKEYIQNLIEGCGFKKAVEE